MCSGAFFFFSTHVSLEWASTFLGLFYTQNMSFRILSRALRSAPRTTLLSTTIIAPRPVVTVPILQNVRAYAKKSKDNKKSKAEQQDVGVEVKEPLFNQGQFEARFEQCVQSLKEHLSNIRVGRANPCKI